MRRPGLLTAVLLLLLLACGGEEWTSTPGSSQTATLARVDAPIELRIEPVDPTIPRSVSLQLRAIGYYSDDTTEDLTNQVTWTSLHPQRVSLSASEPGLATVYRVGTSAVRASLGSLQATTTLQTPKNWVTSLEISPRRPSVPAGAVCSLRATGIFNDGSRWDITRNVTWSSSDEAVATVSSQGQLTAHAMGRAEIRATSGTRSHATSVNVNQAIPVLLRVQTTSGQSEQALVLPTGYSAPLRALALYSDATTRDVTALVTWSSSAPAVAAVEPGGLTRGLARGGASARASLGSLEDSLSVSVRDEQLRSLEVWPGQTLSSPGQEVLLSVVGQFTGSLTLDLTHQVTWSSDDRLVAEALNAPGNKGKVQTRQPGQTLIRARWGGVGASCALTSSSAQLVSLDVTPKRSQLLAEHERAFQATGRFSDGSLRNLTHQVLWRSSQPGVALVSNALGLAGTVQGVSGGVAYIQASLGAIKANHPVTVVGVQQLEIVPAQALSAPGTTRQFRAYGLYPNGDRRDLTRRVQWESLTPTTLPVGPEGLASVVGAGSLRATLGGLSASASLESGAYLYLARGEENAVQGYQIDLMTGSLAALGAPGSTGSLPVDALVDSTGKRLLVLCDLELLSFPIAADGSLGTPVSAPVSDGSRWIAAPPYCDLVYVVNPSSATLACYRIGTGGLSLVSTTPGPAAMGPPATDAQGRVLYVGAGPGGAMTGYTLDPTNGGLSQVYQDALSARGRLLTINRHGRTVSRGGHTTRGGPTIYSQVTETGTLHEVLGVYERYVSTVYYDVRVTDAESDRAGRFAFMGHDCDDGRAWVASYPTPNSSSYGFTSALPAPPAALASDPLGGFLFCTMTNRTELARIPIGSNGVGAAALLETGARSAALAITP